MMSFGSCFQARALETQESEDDLLLLFGKDDMILVFSDSEEKVCLFVWLDIIGMGMFTLCCS